MAEIFDVETFDFKLELWSKLLNLDRNSVEYVSQNVDSILKTYDCKHRIPLGYHNPSVIADNQINGK